jgi:hypothetical protein
MSPTDLPRPSRPLVTESGPPGGYPEQHLDGAPREPAELLAELRLRLSRLADNHPSAGAGPAGYRRTRDSPPDVGLPWQADSPREGYLADGRELLREGNAGEGNLADGRDLPREGNASEGELADRGESPALAGPPEDPGAEWFRSPAGALPEAEFALGSRAQAEAYRPWFMSAESAVPWFADD